MTKENFIEKAKNKHGNKYDYSKVEYVNSKVKICIICPEHGEFWQEPSAHIRGYGCPLCGKNKQGKKDNIDIFIEKAQKIHGDKYDYSKTLYKNSRTKICIICPEHGEFWQLPSAHLIGQGCPKCAGKALSKEELISQFKKIHGNKYDYSNINYIDSKNKLPIICPEHGEFFQLSSKHLIGQGCPKCAIKYRSETQKEEQNNIILRFRKTHGNIFNYSKVNFERMNKKVEIICEKHGSFFQRPYDHINGHGCPKCGNIISKSETEIYEYCCNLLGKENVIQRDRIIITPKEIDIYIPSLKIGIEYNGLRWHSEEFGKNKNYHLEKLIKCQNKGIKLIQVFEDEYISHKEIVLAKIRHLLKCDNCSKIMGRKCEIREINNSIAKVFLEQNHIQGYVRSSVYLGAYYNNNLIAVMTFKKEKNNKWELTRFASDYNFICEGIGGKLFKYFIRNYEFSEIKSFADRRWTINEEHNIYTNLGFKKKCYLEPEYRYFKEEDGIERQHKFGFRKQILHKKYGLPLAMTEKEMTEQLGYSKIWDCGLIKYVYKKEEL